jgi:hypothetical protein
LQVHETENYVTLDGAIHHNSTKTTAALMKVAYHAKQMAKARDGIRHSRAIVVRNTREMLQDSTIPDWMKWFPSGLAGDYLKTERRFMLRFDDVECEVLFRGLDDANDVRRLLSLQASFGILDEFREINPQIFEALQGRLGRYPDGMLVPHRPHWGLDNSGNPIQGCVRDDGTPNKHLWGATNPPEYDSWWQQWLDSPPKNATVVFQPSGMSPEADWTHLLPTDYYADLAEGKADDWVDVYIHGKYGRSLSGKPVFPSFKADFHVAKNPLTHIKSNLKPLIVGLDFGLSPAAAIGQLDMLGRLLVLEALTSEGMGITRFIQEKLKPTLVERFPGHPVIIIGDPAGSQRAQTDERSCFDILKNCGFKVIPARTNATQARISAVERFLSRQVDGGPGFLVDPRAKAIVNALRGGYRYKIKKSGEMEDSPDKNHHSHIADACQYLCLHADGGAMFGSSFGLERREVKAVRAGGWT